MVVVTDQLEQGLACGLTYDLRPTTYDLASLWMTSGLRNRTSNRYSR